MKIKDWIMDWFEKNTDLSKDTIEKSLSEDYLKKGWSVKT